MEHCSVLGARSAGGWKVHACTPVHEVGLPLRPTGGGRGSTAPSRPRPRAIPAIQSALSLKHPRCLRRLGRRGAASAAGRPTAHGDYRVALRLASPRRQAQPLRSQPRQRAGTNAMIPPRHSKLRAVRGPYALRESHCEQCARLAALERRHHRPVSDATDNTAERPSRRGATVAYRHGAPPTDCSPGALIRLAHWFLLCVSARLHGGLMPSVVSGGQVRTGPRWKSSASPTPVTLSPGALVTL